jgi:hypothetical protein
MPEFPTPTGSSEAIVTPTGEGMQIEMPPVQSRVLFEIPDQDGKPGAPVEGIVMGLDESGPDKRVIVDYHGVQHNLPLEEVSSERQTELKAAQARIWGPPEGKTEASPITTPIEHSTSKSIGPIPGHEAGWTELEAGQGEPIDVVAGYTEVAPLRKPTEGLIIGGPGSEDKDALMAAAKPPEEPRYTL